jgi:hypothetical protein
MKKLLFYLVLLYGSAQSKYTNSTHWTCYYKAMVVSAREEASQIGVAIMKKEEML